MTTSWAGRNFIRRCDVCGETFRTNNPIAKRCSKKCKREGQLRSNRERHARKRELALRMAREAHSGVPPEQRSKQIRSDFDEFSNLSEAECDALERELGRTPLPRGDD